MQDEKNIMPAADKAAENMKTAASAQNEAAAIRAQRKEAHRAKVEARIAAREKREGTKKSRIIRAICFTLVLAIMVTGLLCVFGTEYTQMKARFNTYFTEPKNTIDAVYFGSSGVDRYWASPLAYNDYGITVYPFSSDAQNFVIMRYLIEEALTVQDPQLLIIDIRGMREHMKDFSQLSFRGVYDNMPGIRKTRKAAADAFIKYSYKSKEIDAKDDSYYYPFLKYHHRWETGLVPSDFEYVKHDYKGFFMNDRISKMVRNYPSIYFTDKALPIEPEIEALIRELLDYLRTLDKEVLFVVSPYIGSNIRMQNQNYIQNLLESEGFTCIDFNTQEMFDALEVDIARDFYNDRHFNSRAAVRYTRYLANYIDEHYSLPDHRDDPAYASWDEAYRNMSRKMREWWGTEPVM